MTTKTVTAIAVGLVAWRGARGWTSWHIDRAGEPLCGKRIPQSAQVSRRPGLLKIADLCEGCFTVFSFQSEDA